MSLDEAVDRALETEHGKKLYRLIVAERRVSKGTDGMDMISIAKSEPRSLPRWRWDDEFERLSKLDTQGVMHFSSTDAGRALLNASRVAPISADVAVNKSDAYCAIFQQEFKNFWRANPAMSHDVAFTKLYEGDS